MKPSLRGRKMAPRFFMLALLALLAAPAFAQDRGIPDAGYYAAIELLYRGDYQRAQRAFTSELRGAVKTVDSRWVDSICFHTMLGETFYAQGRNAEALEQYDSAVQLFLTYHNFMKRAQFPQLRAEGNRARRQAPWARSSRKITRAALPPTILIQYGSLNNQQAAERGGLVQSAQFWRLNIAEVVRTMALAIRRRTELLGPMSPHDALSRSLEERLSRGGIAPAASWSNAWVDLLTGLAKMSVNKPKEAVAHFGRAALLEGRYDHPLTGVALLAQGEAAMAAGDRPAAAALLVEASLAAFAYEDFEAIDRALWRAHVNHVAAGVEGPLPLLKGAIAWADRENFDPLSLRYRQATAESLILAKQTQPALALLQTRTRSRDLANSPIAAKTQFLTAQALYAEGSVAEAGDTLDRAFALHAPMSLLGFQTQLTNARFDSGALSARLAVQVYDQLLADPAPADWLNDPHDVLSHLKTSHEPAMARWFAAYLGRREFDRAIEAADLAKRRRFFAALPLGGRLVALRQLLHPQPGAPPLAKERRELQQAWMLTHPEYTATTQAAAPIQRVLDGVPTILTDGRIGKGINNALDDLNDIGLQREQLLRAMALERRPAPMDFPPVAKLADVQKRLRQGDAVLMFHQAADSMNGFLIVAGGHHYWRLPNTNATEGRVSGLLKTLGLVSQAAKLPIEDAARDGWLEAARDLGSVLLKDSRLDLSKTERLVIVPDGALWHTPFEMLLAPGSDGRQLIDATPIRYAPTLALAAPSDRPMRPVRRTAVATPKPSSDRSGETDRAVERLVASAQFGDRPAERLQPPVGAPAGLVASAFDLLLVTSESQLNPASPFAWQPAPLDRTGSSLASWMRLGGSATQRLVLGGVHTAAENGLKVGRRARRGLAPQPTGREMFHAACGLLAGGTRTALVSRWTTGGQTHQNLLREFASEAPHAAAPEAWRRSVTLARETRLDPELEPRLEADLDDEPPLAGHPFWWAGYLLLDTSFDPLDAIPPEPSKAAAKK